MNEIFSLTTRPDADLFFSRGDKNDPRLGDGVGRDQSQYAASEQHSHPLWFAVSSIS